MHHDHGHNSAPPARRGRLKRRRVLASLAAAVAVMGPVVAGPGYLGPASAAPVGVVVAWGSNLKGQLGHPLPTPNGVNGNPVPLPPLVLPGLAKAIGAGNNHSLALVTTALVDRVWAWGDNQYGQLGLGDTLGPSVASSFVPAPVTANSAGTTLLGDTAATGAVTDIAGAGDHSLARTDNGRVWAWGRDHSGELGSGATGTVRPYAATVKTNAAGSIELLDVPLGAPGGSATIAGDGPGEQFGSDVAGGHSLAVQRKTGVAAGSGTVQSWGNNASGELGDGTTSAPRAYAGTVTVSGGGALTGIAAVAAPETASYALQRNGGASGTVWSWGDNEGFGELGSGTVGGSRTVAAQVKTDAAGTTNLTNIVGIAAGHHFGVALKDDGTVWTWGQNTYGQLGSKALTSATTSRAYAQKVTIDDGSATGADLTGIVAIAAGGQHSLAIKSDGTVWAWGRNDHSELGSLDPNLIGVNVVNYAVQVTVLSAVGSAPAVGPTVAAKQVACGGSHSLALL